jgi:hypothetical protein
VVTDTDQETGQQAATEAVITPDAVVPDQSPEQALIAASSSFSNYDTGNENKFQVVSDWDPAGAQPEAIKALSSKHSDRR